MEADDEDEGKNSNLATTLVSIAIDTAKLITGVPLEYPDPLLTPLAAVPQPAKEEAVGLSRNHDAYGVSTALII